MAPAAAVADGAKWRRVGATQWLESGAAESDLAPGDYAIEFSPAPGWVAPASRTLTVQAGQTVSVSASYTSRLSAVPGPDWSRYQ